MTHGNDNENALLAELAEIRKCEGVVFTPAQLATIIKLYHCQPKQKAERGAI